MRKIMRKIYGKKLIMTRIFSETGEQIPVTLIETPKNDSLEIFKEKEKVRITSISKGKGFAGTVKRHKFNTGPRTHGSNNYRQPGSIGSTFPQRVVKGRRMAGHKGARKTTLKAAEIFKIDAANHLIYLKGPVPGPINSQILVWSQI
jgi:large subunit ribosomal protein L3